MPKSCKSFQLCSAFCFRPSCQFCVRQVVDGSRKTENAKRIVSAISLHSRGLTNGRKGTVLILQRTVRAQGCLKNMHIKAQRIERPLFRTILGPQIVVCTQQIRHMGFLSRAFGTVRKVVRVRYFIWTGAIGGGLAANQVT